MSCHQIEPHIVDMARGVTSDQDAQLTRHILGCPSCAGLLEQERAMSAALRRLAKDLKEPAEDPHREQALLAMFDQPCTRSRRRVHTPSWAGVVAAGIAFAAALTWHLAGTPGMPRTGTPPIAVAPETRQAALDSASPVAVAESPISTPVRSRGALNADLRLDETADSTEFVAWPGAAAWPPFESGELVRVEIPTSALLSLGFSEPESASGVVQADVLIGQDGFARAVRLVQ